MPAIGFNVHAMYTTRREKDELIAHYRVTKPGATVIMDDPGFALQLASLFPNTAVIDRRSGDDNAHLRLTPKEWIAPYLASFPNPRPKNLYAYCNNEGGVSQQLWDWLLACAKEAAPYPDLKVVFANLSVGTPEWNDWPKAENFLRYITQSQFKDRFVLGIHEYALTNAAYEFMPVTNFEVNPAKWPKQVKGTPPLLGRYRNLNGFCESKGITPPKIILTEYGFDDIRAYETWQQGLTHTPGFKRVGSLHGNKGQWIQWINQAGLNMSWERYAFEQLYAVWKLFYNTPQIIGVCLFCYGGEEGYDERGDPKWRLGYDYSKSSMPEFLPLLEKADWTMATSPTPTPQPTTETYLSDATWRFNTRIRATPSTTAAIRGSIPAGKRAQITGAAHVNQGFIWTPIVYNGVSGWSALGEVETPATPAPSEPEPDPSLRYCDGYDPPVGTDIERASDKVWPGLWTDANPFLTPTFNDSGVLVSYHTGSDLNLNKPTWDSDKLMPFYACADGVVIWAQEFKGWANLIVVRHFPLADGTVMYSRYAHSDTIEVGVGNEVKRGQRLGVIGNAEGTMAYHLHFDLSHTTLLEHHPSDWPKTARARIEQNYVNPKVFIWKNRPRRT